MRRGPLQSSNAAGGDSASSSSSHDDESKGHGNKHAQFLGALTLTILFLYVFTADHSPIPIKEANISTSSNVRPVGMLRAAPNRKSPTTSHNTRTYMETTSAYLREHVRPLPTPRSGPVMEIHGGNANHLGRIAACPKKGSSDIFGTKFGHCVTETEHDPVRLCESESTCTHVVWNIEGTYATMYVNHDWTPIPSYLSDAGGPNSPWWKLKDCQEAADSGIASKVTRAAWAQVRVYDVRTVLAARKRQRRAKRVESRE